MFLLVGISPLEELKSILTLHEENNNGAGISLLKLGHSLKEDRKLFLLLVT